MVSCLISSLAKSQIACMITPINQWHHSGFVRVGTFSAIHSVEKHSGNSGSTGAAAAAGAAGAGADGGAGAAAAAAAAESREGELACS